MSARFKVKLTSYVGGDTVVIRAEVRRAGERGTVGIGAAVYREGSGDKWDPRAGARRALARACRDGVFNTRERDVARLALGTWQRSRGAGWGMGAVCQGFNTTVTVSSPRSV